MMNIKKYIAVAMISLATASCGSKSAPPSTAPKPPPVIPYGDVLSVDTIYQFTPLSSPPGGMIKNDRDKLTIDATSSDGQSYRIFLPAPKQGYNSETEDVIKAGLRIGDVKISIDQGCMKDRAGLTRDADGKYISPASGKWNGTTAEITIPQYDCILFYGHRGAGRVPSGRAKSYAITP